MGGGSGTRKILTPFLKKSLLDIDSDPSVIHRNIYRGKNLGTEFTDEQKAHIADGSFKDLYVGDYWVDGDNIWRIADIDRYIMSGASEASGNILDHHITIMPDYIINGTYYQMHSGDIGDVGYLGSLMKTQTIPNIVEPIVNRFFGSDNILEISKSMVNSVSSDNERFGQSIEISRIDLPHMLDIIGWTSYYGKYAFIVPSQLSLMQLNPSRMIAYKNSNTKRNYWTMDPRNQFGFAMFGNTSSLNSGSAGSTTTAGIRPIFSVKG